MSSEERQRQIRQQGNRPAEAEKEESARSGREQLGRSEAERSVGQQRSPDEKTPLPEDDTGQPRPRR